jgi:hypothetical protein
VDQCAKLDAGDKTSRARATRQLPARITDYRLSFDPNPKELARRDSAGSHVVLLWCRRRHRAAVVVDEDATGELVELDSRERENPLELYQHAYAYLPTRGHPGKHSGTPGASGQAAA